jgi:hypothetical protein
MNIWGIQEFTKKLKDRGYKITADTVYFHTRCGNFTYTKKVDGVTYVYTDPDLKYALDYGKKHSRKKKSMH